MDLSANGEAFVGRVLPVPENSDADRSLMVRWLSNNATRGWPYENEPIIEVHFVQHSSSILVLTTEHSLIRYDRATARSTTIDTAVFGPMSLDQLGQSVVYTRGEPPELRVVQASITAGTTRVVDERLYPAWCPTLSPNGQTIAFVASPDGEAHFYRTTANSQTELWSLPLTTPLPTGPTAPVWTDQQLTYESDGTLYTLSATGTIERAMEGVGLPIHVAGSNGVMVQNRQHQMLELTAHPGTER